MVSTQRLKIKLKLSIGISNKETFCFVEFNQVIQAQPKKNQKMDQKDGLEQNLNIQQNLELYNNQERVQKNDLLEQILKAKVNEDLVQWLVGQLNQAKTLCFELKKENMQNQETHLKNLIHVIDNSLEKIQNSKISQEIDMSNNSVSQESQGNQGTSFYYQSYQDNFLTNINYFSDMNKQLVIFNQAIQQSSQEEDQLDFQRGSEQFRHSEQYSDYNQMHNHQQQQKQIQQIMSQEEDQQSSIQHNMDQEPRLSDFQQYMAIKQWIKNHREQEKYLKEEINTFKKRNQDDLNQLNYHLSILDEKHSQALKNQQSITQKLLEEIEQHTQFQQISDENNSLQQLSKKYQDQIENQLQQQQKLTKEIKKNVKNIIVEQLNALIREVQALFIKQSDKFKIEKDILSQEYQQEKQSYSQELNQYQQLLEEYSLGSINDNNVKNMISDMKNLLTETFKKTSQATQSLNRNNLDSLVEQINQIHHNVTGQAFSEINDLKIQLKQMQQENQKLKDEKKASDEKIKVNTKSLEALQKILQQFQQEQQNQLDQTNQIQQQANKIQEIESLLLEIKSYYNGKLEEEKNNFIQKQLESPYKLQDRSLFYIQLGLRIFHQYYKSDNLISQQQNLEFQNKDKIQIFIDRLIDLHKNYQQKESIKQKDLNKIEEIYKNYEKELNNLYDETYKFYNEFITSIKMRRGL